MADREVFSLCLYECWLGGSLLEFGVLVIVLSLQKIRSQRILFSHRFLTNRFVFHV
jgi:hypothetical protein